MEDRRLDEDEIKEYVDGYRIVELNISNIKRIKAVSITPKSDLVILEGDNAQGKTSVLDGISYLLGGKRLIPEEPIRKGEKTGYAEALFGDFQISRNWTNPYTSYLKIKTKDGVEPKNPQTFLNERIGSVSLEVAELVNMDKDERIKVFKRITGLNLDDLAEKQDRVMELRKDKNKDLARSNAEMKSYADLADIEEGLNFDELQKERRKKELYNEAYRDKEEFIEDLSADRAMKINIIEDNKREIEDWRKDIAELEINIKETTKEIKNIDAEIIAEKRGLEAMVKTDLTEIDKKIKQAVDSLDLKAKHDRKKEVQEEIDKVSKKVDGYNVDLDKIRDERTKRIKESKVPVEGVEFDGESIRYKGIEFEECSTAEQIEMSIAIGIKENPKIRIILIRDGSAIGRAAKERIRDLAKENNFQIWIERVAESKGNEIFIEDGEIK